MSNPPPDGFEWLDDPVTVNPDDYLKRMAASDSKPGDAIKRARERLRYARKEKHFIPAPPPFPSGHVFADVFFRWLLKKYPGIEGIHPHYGQTLLVSGCQIRWRNAIQPQTLLDPITAIQQENERLKTRIWLLEEQLDKANKEINQWKERDIQRKRNCGRRPMAEKRNS